MKVRMVTHKCSLCTHKIIIKNYFFTERADLTFFSLVASVTLPIWKRPLKSTDVNRVRGQRAEDLRRASPGAVILKVRWSNQQSMEGQDTTMII